MKCTPSIFILLTLFLVKCDLKNPAPINERVFYEIFVQSFYDTDGDGIGDLNGVTEKLDYLEDLGIKGLWLLPVSPSPSYHKYDVVDYYGIHPDYGTMEDMKNLLAEAHKRDILVLLDMVINHSSSEHKFFREARKGMENPYRDYYVWSSDPEVHAEEPWHWHSNGDDLEKYYGFFWKGMPDLNFDNPRVREEMKNIGKFWLEEVGVDGFRLDAIKYIYPDSLVPKNVKWWQEYREELETTGKAFFLVAEIWDNSEFIKPFLDNGVHSAFNFDLSFAIEKMLTQRKDPGIASLLAGIHQEYMDGSGFYHDAIFIKNHDQDRIMSLLPDPRQAKLAASILFTLPGIPFLYYGEEIAMLGKKPDEYIREPMVWDSPGMDKGQTAWLEAQYSVPGNVVPVKQQLENPESILTHYKKLLALRNENPSMANGRILVIEQIPEYLCAYLLSDENKEMLIIHNLTADTKKISAGLLNARGRKLYLDGALDETEDGLILNPFGSLIQYID